MAEAAVSVVAAHWEIGDMKITRLFRHFFYPPWLVRVKFPPATMHKIEAAIRKSETLHDAEIRFAVEGSLDLKELWQDKSSFDRAVEVFAQLGVWDTEQNNGVLIYLLLADRKIEIIADRGVDRKVAAKEWQRICRAMETLFRKNEFEAGVLAGIDAISKLLVELYPAGKDDENELANEPVVL